MKKSKSTVSAQLAKVSNEKRKTLPATPTLGKGFSVGQEISLDVPVKKSKSTVSAQLAKVSDESSNFTVSILGHFAESLAIRLLYRAVTIQV